MDVDEPILIDVSSYKDIMAYMIMDSLSIEKEYWPESYLTMARSVRYEFPGDTPKLYFADPELPLLILDRTKLAPGIGYHTSPSLPDPRDAAQRSYSSSVHNSDKIEDKAKKQPVTEPTSSIPVRENEKTQAVNLAAGAFHPCGFGLDCEVEMLLSLVAIQRWVLCTQALVRPGFIDRMSDGKHHINNDSDIIKGWQIGQGKMKHFVITRMTSGRILGSSLNITFASIPFHISTLLLPLAYGGIHLAARNTHFPSATEFLLWKISAITVMVFVPCCYLLLISIAFGELITDMFSETFNEWLSKRTSGRTRASLKNLLDNVNLVLFFGASPALMVLMVGFSRLYLVVESFISLRAIPLGALATTPWVQSIPHL